MPAHECENCYDVVGNRFVSRQWTLGLDTDIFNIDES